ncbi:hypothetical protein ACWEQ4_01445 [Rhodococcus sp. NPDC003994]
MHAHDYACTICRDEGNIDPAGRCTNDHEITPRMLRTVAGAVFDTALPADLARTLERWADQLDTEESERISEVTSEVLALLRDHNVDTSETCTACGKRILNVPLHHAELAVGHIRKAIR